MVSPTAGEAAVLHLLRTSLEESSWEFYEQPHLNGKRPDIVALCPGIGIVIIEVKDGRGSRDPQTASRQVNEAVLRLEAVMPGLVGLRRADVRAVAVLTNSYWTGTAPVLDEVTVCAGEGWEEQLLTVFQEIIKFRSSARIDKAVADDIRHWLVQPEFDREQWRPIQWTPQQEEIIYEGIPRRRVRGVAGSGKTEALVGRAVQIRASGAASVLFLCFNLTLVTYLRDRIRAHERFADVEPGGITILHWHGWAKEVMLRTPVGDDTWRSIFIDRDTDSEDVMADAGRVVRSTLEEMGGDLADHYDAVIVDEGQDIPPECVKAASCVLRDGGELLLAGDRAQDLYGRVDDWTAAAYDGLRFPRWKGLKGSQRVPTGLAALVARFEADSLGRSLEEWEHEATQGVLPFASPTLLWLQVSPGELVRAAVEAGIDVIAESTESAESGGFAAWADLVVAAPTTALVGMIAGEFRGRGFEVLDTYSDRDSRPKKSRFYKGHAAVKVTTIHSLKGFSVTRYVVVLHEGFSLGASWEPLLTTALTRLTGREHGGAMTVVCADSHPRLRELQRGFESIPSR